MVAITEAVFGELAGCCGLDPWSTADVALERYDVKWFAALPHE